MDYSNEFNNLYAEAIAWFIKRNRYRYLKLDVVNAYNDNYYSCFKANRNVAHIVLYKPQMIKFYKENSAVNSKDFKYFFIATIIHELVHRKQWIKLDKNYEEFKRKYKFNCDNYEQEAVMAELRYWETH